MTQRPTAISAFVALSVGVGTLALLHFPDQALALAIPGYSGLTALLHHKVARVEASIGPVNGSNVHQLLERLIALDQYQHTRNHDILGALSPTNAGLSLQITELRRDLRHELRDMARRLPDPPTKENTR